MPHARPVRHGGNESRQSSTRSKYHASRLDHRLERGRRRPRGDDRRRVDLAQEFGGKRVSDELEQSGYWVYGEPPITHRPLEAALSDAERITAERLRKAIDDAADRIAKDYGPQWSYKHTAYPLSNPPVGDPIQGNKWVPADKHDEPTNELATGGVLQRRGNEIFGSDSGHEIVYMPRGAIVHPRTEPAQFVLLPSESAREFIRKEVHKALYGDGEGLVNVRQHRRVRLIEDGGDEWCGTLYRAEKEDKG